MRTRPTTIVILAILILALTVPDNMHFPTMHLPTTPTVHATTQTITLNESVAKGWNNSIPGPTITVTENDSLTVNLRSIDVPTPAPHQLYVDVDQTFNPCASSIDKCSAFFNSTTPAITYQFKVDFPAGAYTYYCTVHRVSWGTFLVKGFKISSAPNSIAVVQGTSAQSTITLISINGFSGPASLTASSATTGLATSLNPSSLSLAAGGTSAGALNVTASPTLPAGTYNVQVQATIGSVTHTVNLPVTVKQPGFSLVPNPRQLALLQGSSKTTTIAITSLNTFTGNIKLNATNPPGGVSTSFSPTNVTLNNGQTTAATLNVTVASNATSGDYNLTITGTSSTVTNTTTVTLIIGEDFNLTASPLSLTLPQGSSVSSTITLTSLNGFKGNITLSSTILTGLTGSFNVTSPVTISPGQVAHVSITISAYQSTSPELFTIIITGRNNTRVHILGLNIVVSGFTVDTSPSSLNMTQGATRFLTITLTSVNSFSGNMNLTLAGSSAMTYALTQSSRLLNSNQNLTATLTVSASGSSGLTTPGSYLLNITGSSGSLSHSKTVTVKVTALPPSPASSNQLPIAIFAGLAASASALVVAILFFLKRRAGKATRPPASAPS